METNPRFDVFISYARKDFDAVSAVKKQLETQIPELSYWFDLTGIESGEQFTRRIVSAIDKSDIVLFFLSEASLASHWTEKEVRYARNKGKRVIPIMLKNAKLDGWFLFEFGDTDCIDSTNPLQMQKLISNLSSWTGKAQKKKEEKKVDVKPEPKPSPAPKPEPIPEPKPAPKPKAEKETPKPEPESKPTSPTTKKPINPLIWVGAILAVLIISIFAVKGCSGEDTETEVEADFRIQADTTITVNGVSFGMIAVEGGTFQMGATPEQGSDADDDEKPVHKVTLSSYRIGQTQVTQELWQAVMGSNPSFFKGAKLPVEQVSWDDCQEFIQKLNQLTGQTFRLPTEAEWEFAARGGNKSKGYKYSGSNDLSEVAWFDDNSSSKTHEVATKKPNELGLYDMSGNVWEWCADWKGSYSNSAQTDPTGPTSGSYRAFRGGMWSSTARYCRVSARSYLSPSFRYYSLGLRLAM